MKPYVRYQVLQLGPLFVRDKLVLELNGEKVWFFHGDIFDVTMKYSKWLTKLGGHGYELLILLNRWVNLISVRMGYGKLSLSKKIKIVLKQPSISSTILRLRLWSWPFKKVMIM